jgi:quinol-cytochrome oxidoreductase complex cytochrome b subunit
LLPLLILFDAYIGLRPAVRLIPGMEALGITDIVAEVIIPVVVMVGLSVILVFLLRPLRPSRRDVIIGLFSAFIVTYIFLTIIGTAFRGHGMQLFWPWEIGAPIE